MVGAVPNWSYLWCEVKAGIMRGWRCPEESNKEPLFAVDLIPKVLVRFIFYQTYEVLTYSF